MQPKHLTTFRCIVASKKTVFCLWKTTGSENWALPNTWKLALKIFLCLDVVLPLQANAVKRMRLTAGSKMCIFIWLNVAIPPIPELNSVHHQKFSKTFLANFY